MNSELLDPFAAFPYLGCTVAYNNKNWAALYQNLCKARSQWVMVGKVVSKTGATVQVWGILYKSDVQSVLLYVSESWVVTGEILKVIEGFHHLVARSITDITLQHTTGGDCECPPISEALDTSGL